MRPIPRSLHRQRDSARKPDPAQFVLPFLGEPEASCVESSHDHGSPGDSGERMGGNVRTPILDPALNGEESPTQRRSDDKPENSHRSKPKSAQPIHRKAPATAARVDVFSVPPNIIALIESKSGAWSAPELAELLGCTGKHIYALAKSGRMPHLRIGTMVRFDPTATAEWLRNRFIAA